MPSTLSTSSMSWSPAVELNIALSPDADWLKLIGLVLSSLRLMVGSFAVPPTSIAPLPDVTLATPASTPPPSMRFQLAGWV